MTLKAKKSIAMNSRNRHPTCQHVSGSQAFSQQIDPPKEMGMALFYSMDCNALLVINFHFSTQTEFKEHSTFVNLLLLCPKFSLALCSQIPLNLFLYSA